MTALTARPQLLYNDKYHTYHLGETRLPSVSQILGVIRKPFLEQWRGNVGNAEADRIAREAADHGTAVHLACELYADEKADEFARAAMRGHPSVAAYADWMDTNVTRVIAVEPMVLSLNHGYAGRADLVIELQDGSITIVDLKTSSEVSEDYALQLEAYRRALIETGDIVPTRRLVVHMPRKEPGKLRVVEFAVEDAQRDWRAFLACSIIWHRLFKADAFAPRRNILGRRP